jgi:tetratricopeptide (TPR) repeat protein
MKRRSQLLTALRVVVILVGALGPLPTFAQSAETFLKQGLVLYERGDLAGAMAAFSKGIGADPKNAVLYASRGVVKRRQGDLAGALADETRAIELDPKMPEAHTNRGVIRLAMKDVDGAIADHSKAIELNPKYDEAYNNRGLARLSKGDINGALADLGEALKLNPFYPEAYVNLASAQIEKGDAVEALRQVSRAITMRPRMAEAYAVRGLAFMKINRAQPADGDGLPGPGRGKDEAQGPRGSTEGFSPGSRAVPEPARGRDPLDGGCRASHEVAGQVASPDREPCLRPPAAPPRSSRPLEQGVPLPPSLRMTGRPGPGFSSWARASSC